MKIKKAIEEIRKILQDNILERYDNPEYWDWDLVDDLLNQFSEEEQEKIIKEVEKL